VEDPAVARIQEFIGPSPYNPSSRDPPDFTHNLDFEMDSDVDTTSDLDSEAGSPPRHFPFENSSALNRFPIVEEQDEPDTSYLAFLPSSLDSSPPLSRSTSSSSVSNSSCDSGLTSPIGHSYVPHTPRNSTTDTGPFCAESVVDLHPFIPQFDDPPYSVPYGEIMSQPTFRPDSQWNISEPWVSPSPPNVTPIPIPHPSPPDVELLVEPQVVSEPSTSAGTIRSPLRERPNEQKRSCSPHVSGTNDDSKMEMVDGGGWDGQAGQRGYADMWDRGSNGTGGSSSGGHGKEGGSNNGHHSGSSGGSGRGGGDGDRNWRSTNGRSAFSTPSDSDSSEDEETSTDDYGEDSSSHRTSKASPSRLQAAESAPQDALGADDDIPLAQRIPTALTAQRTIQKQVRDERDQRRKDRALRRQQEQQGAESRSRKVTLRSAATNSPGLLSSREAALRASSSIKRARTKTLTGNQTGALAIADLTHKLLKVQDSSVQRPHHEESLSTPPPVPKVLHAQVRNLDRVGIKEPYPPQNTLVDREREMRLRHARSFHRPTPRDMTDKSTPTRSVSTVNGRSHAEPRGLYSGSSHSDDVFGLDKFSKSRKSSEEGMRPSTSTGRPSVGGLKPSTIARRPSTSLGAGRSSANGRRLSASGGRPSISGGRPSIGEEPTPPRTSGDLTTGSLPQRGVRTAVPPPRPSEALSNLSQPSTKAQVTQQRVFIGDMQSFNMVEIGSSTSAGDVLRIVESQGALKQLAGNGTWMLWEVAQDFGMGE